MLLGSPAHTVRGKGPQAHGLLCLAETQAGLEACPFSHASCHLYSTWPPTGAVLMVRRGHLASQAPGQWQHFGVWRLLCSTAGLLSAQPVSVDTTLAGPGSSPERGPEHQEDVEGWAAGGPLMHLHPLITASSLK